MPKKQETYEPILIMKRTGDYEKVLREFPEAGAIVYEHEYQLQCN